VWCPRAQKPPDLPLLYTLRVWFSSMWKQGICSSYRFADWRFLWLMLRNWASQPAKLWLGFMMLLSAHHFLIYARLVAEELERECRALEEAQAPGETVGVLSSANLSNA
jgi:hypothetical protein